MERHHRHHIIATQVRDDERFETLSFRKDKVVTEGTWEDPPKHNLETVTTNCAAVSCRPTIIHGTHVDIRFPFLVLMTRSVAGHGNVIEAFQSPGCGGTNPVGES
jgi:hypothetical protein